MKGIILFNPYYGAIDKNSRIQLQLSISYPTFQIPKISRLKIIDCWLVIKKIENMQS